jgi:hypothetical protein
MMMKESQHDQHRSMKRDADEDKKRVVSGGEGLQRSMGARSGGEGGERPERDGQSRLDLAQLIENLRQQFEQDRALASQTGSARCGICYLYYRQTDLVYREEEGFYICKSCQRSLGNGKLKMVRRQQR